LDRDSDRNMEGAEERKGDFLVKPLFSGFALSTTRETLSGVGETVKKGGTERERGVWTLLHIAKKSKNGSLPQKLCITLYIDCLLWDLISSRGRTKGSRFHSSLYKIIPKVNDVSIRGVFLLHVGGGERCWKARFKNGKGQHTNLNVKESDNNSFRRDRKSKGNAGSNDR